MSNGGFSISPSSSWAISINGGAAGGLVGGVEVFYITLTDCTSQTTYNGCISGTYLALGLGEKEIGWQVSASTDGPTFFKVDPPMYASDFDNTLCTMFDMGGAYGGGSYSETYLTLHGINHCPSPLDVGGLSVSGGTPGAAFTLSPVLYLYVPGQRAKPVDGPAVAPGDDPTCDPPPSDPNPNDWGSSAGGDTGGSGSSGDGSGGSGSGGDGSGGDGSS